MADFKGSELVLGGQRSGKSRRAEMRARAWLDARPEHRAVMIATGQAWDSEMRERIERHQQDRARSLPNMVTVEEPRALTEALRQHSAPDTLVVIDCLTLWLSNVLMPLDPARALGEAAMVAAGESLCAAITEAAGPVVLVSNEVGLGVVPMGREVRAYVDALGRLNQQVAQVCGRVTLMAAGLPLALKGTL
jgi:adenosylcobinamide kinase / adenosylcobinamide-phosphate guanylyltransferase